MRNVGKNRPQSSGLTRAGDSSELREQIKELEKRDYKVKRCSEYHLKIGLVNYFWTTGTITTDPDIKHPEKGFDALLDLLQKITQKKESELTIAL